MNICSISLFVAIYSIILGESLCQICTPSCINKGLCVYAGGNPVCACAAGWSGTYCQTPPPTTTTAATCLLTCLNGTVIRYFKI